jgi:hypothetical protein
MNSFRTKVGKDNVTLAVEGVEWLVRRFQDPTGYTYYVGQWRDGRFLLLEKAETYVGVFEHKNLEELVEGVTGSITNEIPAALARLICRKLRIERYNGHPVEEWFRDPEVVQSGQR